MRFLHLPVLLSLVWASSAAGQSSQAATANAGIFFDSSTGGFRMVNGLPGAAVAEAPVKLSLNISNARVSRTQSFAVGATETGMEIISLDGSGPPVRPLDGVSIRDEFRLSPLGKAAAFFSRAEAIIRVFTGLPNQASIDHQIVLPPGILVVGMMAISDDGQYVLAAIQDGGEKAQTAIFDASGATVSLDTSIAVSSAEFLPDSHDNVLADAGADRVYLRREVHSAMQVVATLGSTDGINHPVAVGTSQDANTMFIANGGDQSILAFDATTGTTLRRVCPCSVTGLYPLAGNAAFRLNDSPASAVWLADMNRPELRITFAAQKQGKGSFRNKPPIGVQQ